MHRARIRQGSDARLVGLLLAFAATVYLQALTHAVYERAGLLLYLAATGAVVLLRFRHVSVPLRQLTPLGILLGMGAAISLLANQTGASIPYFRSGVYMLLGGMAWFSASDAARERALTALSFLALFAIACIVAGAVYALSGGGPQFSVQNLDGFTNNWMLTTFSRENYSGAIRASWIFDEPGTLSYYLTSIALARHFSGRRLLPTLIIIIGALLTYSTAQLLMTSLFLLLVAVEGPLASWKRGPRGALVTISWVTAGVLLAGSAVVLELLPDTSLFFNRIDETEGAIRGNNRSTQILRLADNAELSTIAFGRPECYADPSSTKCYAFGDQTSNLFSPIFYGGAVYSFPFYLLLACLVAGLLAPRTRLAVRLAMLMILAMQLQRPYFFAPAYVLVSIVSIQWIPMRFPRVGALFFRFSR